MISAITCSECSRPSRSPPPGWSSLTGCVVSGPSLLPDPSSSYACRRTDRQVRQRDGLRCLRAGRLKHVCDAHDRSIAWGNELGEGGGPLGGSVIMAHLSVTLQPVVVVTVATAFERSCAKSLSPHHQQPSSCVFDM